MKISRDVLAMLIDRGLPQKQIAAKLGVAPPSVSVAIKKFGFGEAFWARRNLGFCYQNTRKVCGVREYEMFDRYSSGETLQSIANDYGVTRERVRQLLKKNFGISGRDGGMAASAKKRKLAAIERKDKEYIQKWGHDFAAHRRMLKIGRKLMDAGVGRERTPIGAFIGQRRNAKKRGIEWKFTFSDWWKVWVDSGHWDSRGRSKNNFVMCRKNDCGPYSAENCYIATLSQNSSDYMNHTRSLRNLEAAA